MTSGQLLAVRCPGHSDLHNLSPTVHVNIMMKATAGDIPVLPSLSSWPKGASLTGQSQKTIHGESLTFPGLPLCDCCSDFKNRRRLSHLKAKTSQEG